MTEQDTVTLKREDLEKLRAHLGYLESWQAKDGAAVVVEVAQEALAILSTALKGG